jgi:hypothetical protein
MIGLLQQFTLLIIPSFPLFFEGRLRRIRLTASKRELSYTVKKMLTKNNIGLIFIKFVVTTINL